MSVLNIIGHEIRHMGTYVLKSVGATNALLRGQAASARAQGHSSRGIVLWRVYLNKSKGEKEGCTRSGGGRANRAQIVRLELSY